MSDDAYGATVAKRRLSRRLYELRRDVGHTANHVCDLLDWGRGKVGRFEANHWKRPEMSDIRDLLRVYGVDEAERRNSSSSPSRPGPGPGGGITRTCSRTSSPGSRTMPSGSGSACRSCCRACCRPRTTRRRSACRLQAAHLAEAGPEARLRRQQILERTDAPLPSSIAVIAEAALMYRWGTKDERREQIMHLVQLGGQPERGVAHPALRRRAAPGHVVHDQHFRLRRRRAEPRLT